MIKNRITLSFLVLVLIMLTQTLYSQDSGRRYTFIAKDGSQIINVFLVQEEENTYIVQISNGTKTVEISKKNIEKLIPLDSKFQEHYHPVIGKKSDIKLPGETEKKENSSSDGNDYYLSFGLTGYGISNMNSRKSYNSGGWGAEVLPVLGFNSIGYFQTGLGLNYNRFDSSVPEKSSAISLYCLFAYFQLSDKPELLSFDNFYLRPFIGADLGGALLYKYSRSEDDDEDQSSTEKIYPKEPYYGFRFGLGINPGISIPVELLLSVNYSVVDDNDIQNFVKLSFGINYNF